MAINFPNTPVQGSSYTYLGITYTYKDAGGGTGLWQISTPGTYGIASPAEIDAEVDNAKYITPFSLAGATTMSRPGHKHSASTDITSGTLPVIRGGTGVTSSTGSTNTVLSASPALTGNPTAPKQAFGNNSTRLATTSFVQAAYGHTIVDTGWISGKGNYIMWSNGLLIQYSGAFIPQWTGNYFLHELPVQYTSTTYYAFVQPMFHTQWEGYFFANAHPDKNKIELTYEGIHPDRQCQILVIGYADGAYIPTEPQ